MKEFQKMQDDLGSFKRINKLIQESQKMQDQTNSLLGISNWMEGYQTIQDKLKSFMGIPNWIEESQKIQDQLKSLGGIPSWMEESQKIQDQLKSFVVSDLLEESLRTQSRLNNFDVFKETYLENIFDRIKLIHADSPSVNFTVHQDGTISSQNQILDVSQIYNIIDSCLSSSANSGHLSREIIIDTFFKQIAKQHPIITKIIIHLLIPVLISIFTMKYFSENIHFDKTNIIRSIKKEAITSIVDKNLLREYRFVTATTLNVRVNHSTHSVCVGKLYFGQLVHIIQKKRNWTLIEYLKKDDEFYIRGWVFTRYIERFK
jgi:hypothetical protein